MIVNQQAKESVPTQAGLPMTRLHALDNLRAWMMWLGIVLHVAANHMTGPMLLPWRDQATSVTADVLTAVIHVFRMPMFLMLAGYFVAWLVAQRGAQAMLRHRMRRIAVPFMVFWPPVFALTGVLAMLYAHRAARGSFGLDAGLLPTVPHVPLVNTMHLWFLYQLIGLVLLTFVALRWAPRVPGQLREGVMAAWGVLGERPWGFAVLALPLGLIGALYPFGVLAVTGSFLPPLSEWLHHGLFYAFGYGLYVHRERLLPYYTRHATRYGCAGGLVCVASLWLLMQVHTQPQTVSFAFRVVAAWAYNAATWLCCFALIGWALRHLNRPSPLLRYMAQSSYWVYIVHMLGTIGFGALLYGAPWPAELKMAVNIVATTAMGLVTYQLFVRHTAIGRLLNGTGRSQAARAPALQSS